jgi:integrase
MKGRPITNDEFKLFRSKTVEVVGETALESWLYIIDGLVESGLRISELMQVSWDQPDTIKPVWRDGKEPTLSFPAETQKNNKHQETPLLSGFEELLLKTPEEQRSGYIFNPISLRTKRGSEPKPGRPKAEWVGNVIGRIGKESGVVVVPANTRTGAPAKYISAHDLRRTCGQRLQDAGVPVEIISKVLRHGSSVTTRKHYIQGNVQNDAKMLKEIMGKRGTENEAEE